MQNKKKTDINNKKTSCATCGKTFQKNEMKVSYDFERFYCFHCDDARITLRR